MQEKINQSELKKLTNSAVETVLDKNQQYGNSFQKVSTILKIMCPDGVPANKLKDLLFITRVLDKLNRLATSDPADTEDPIFDILGYAILHYYDTEKKSNEHK